MKKNLKICMLMGVFAVFVVMAVFTLYFSNVGAQSDVKLTIKEKNVAFEGGIYLLFAVDSEGVGNEQAIKLLVWRSPQEKYEYGKEDELLTYDRSMAIDGKEYPVFVLKSLAAKQMTDNVYAVAYYDGVYSAPVKYSILQYAHNRLNASENSEFKDLLADTLEYGASAQIYFNYHKERLANATYYNVNIENGVLLDGFSYGIFKSGVNVSIKSVDKPNKVFKDWVDEDNNVLGTSSTLNFTVKKDITVTARYEDNPTFVVDKVSAVAGQKNVAVNVAVKNNPGISSIKLVVTNDAGITLTGFSYNTAVIGGQVTPYNASASKTTLVWVNGSNDVNGDWVFATLYFDVNDSANGSYGISITYDEDDVYNISEDNINFDIVNGSITVG